MREALATIANGKRYRFSGAFKRYGKKAGWRGMEKTTVLLVDIKFDNGKDACNHLWFNLTKQLAAINLWEGMRLEFDARVATYEKGYKGHRFDDMSDASDPSDFKPVETDFKLSHPNHFKIAGTLAGDQLALFGASMSMTPQHFREKFPRRQPGPLTDDSLCPWQKKFPGVKMIDVDLSFLRWFVANCETDKQGNPSPWYPHVKQYLAARQAKTPGLMMVPLTGDGPAIPCSTNRMKKGTNV
jgi:hypothetical protein